MINAKFSGTAEMFRNLEREISKIKGKSNKNFNNAAEYILEESKKLVPVVDSGDVSRDPHPGGLRDSGFVSPMNLWKNIKGIFTGKTIGYMIGYSSEYAWRTHENERSGKTEGKDPQGRQRYPYWANNGQWKFLETILLTKQSTILRIIAGK
jgi:hypothetical protein